MEKKSQSIILVIMIAGFLFGWVDCGCAAGAMLYVSPEENTYMVGEEFSVVIKIDSGTTEINATEAVLSYSADKLSVKRVSKSGSIFNLWVQEPSFSNSAGTIVFEGIVLNPGYTGSAGKIITINFFRIRIYINHYNL